VNPVSIISEGEGGQVGYRKAIKTSKTQENNNKK
jgi:hypothetical protein